MVIDFHECWANISFSVASAYTTMMDTGGAKCAGVGQAACILNNMWPEEDEVVLMNVPVPLFKGNDQLNMDIDIKPCTLHHIYMNNDAD